MRNSQYLESYLDSGYTIGTYLAYTLHGAAKRYSGRYATALRNACEREVKAGRAIVGASKLGKVAYFRSI